MMDLRLKARLEESARRSARARFWLRLALSWAGVVVVAVVLAVAERQLGRAFGFTVPLVVGLLAATLLWAVRQGARQEPEWRSLAHRLERMYPYLDGRLLTAVQQQPGPDNQFNCLQEQVLREVLRHSYDSDWAAVTPAWKVTGAQAANVAVLVCLAAVLMGLRPHPGSRSTPIFAIESLTVTPGNTTVERGTSVAILARFSGKVPGSATLAIEGAPDGAVRAAGAEGLHTSEVARIPLVKSLSDPIFGAHLPEVLSNLTYTVEYGERQSEKYKITVFEYPKLERADATVTSPDYTGQSVKRIEDVRRLSAVEGSKIELALRFNKPVAQARFVPKDKKRAPLAIATVTNDVTGALAGYALAENETFDLQLVDFEGRTNKVPARFVFEALKNRPPELKLAFPRGDIRPTPIEEVVFEGSAWDDFGVEAFGIGLVNAGKEPEYVELGRGVPAKEKRPFRHVLKLEELGVHPDELVAWFVWADDVGPDGQQRRSPGDLYFAEIRPFEEVFREGQDGDQGEQQQDGSQQSQEGGRSGQLAQVQKQILTATWKLHRQRGKTLVPKAAPAGPRRESRMQPSETPERKPNVGVAGMGLPSGEVKQQVAATASLGGAPVKVFGQTAAAAPAQKGETKRSSARRQAGGLAITNALDDLAVVRDAQQQLLEQAKETLQRQPDARSGPLWREAVGEMEKALERLKQAIDKSAPLEEALAAEQAAYQALLKLQEHEFQVSRRRQSQGQQGRGQSEQMQRELEQLDLANEENRYENKRMAQRPQTPQQREQLQVMNRLQELARRQEDFNERLKELQTALREARTEQEREEIRRRLKRLEEEERQMLADVDELRQRMDRPENQSEMAESRKQLDEVRQDVQRAAEAANENSISQSLASGTRAQRQMQEMREEMRRQSSNQFSDAMKEMRSQARELAAQQEKLVKQMEQQEKPANRTLSDDGPSRENMIQELSRQKERLTNLVSQANAISEQAENAEPVLSRQLYDSVRKFSQDNAKAVKEMQEELISRGMMTRELYDKLERGQEPDGAKLMDVASEMMRLDLPQQAGAAGKRSQEGIENLRRGVEQAAGNLLGDDTEALRLAEQELNQLSDGVREEMAREQAAGSTNGQARATGSRGSSSTNGVAQAEPGRDGDREEGRAPNGNTNEVARAGNQEGGERTRPGEESMPDQAATPETGQGERQRRQAQNEGSQSRNNRPGERTSPGGGTRPPEDPNSAREQQSAQASPGEQENGRSGRQPRGGPGGGSGFDLQGDLDRFLNERSAPVRGPITGDEFLDWSDRLRNVEEMLDAADLRNGVAGARDRARRMRQDYKREGKAPDWAIVQKEVLQPLVEVRDRVKEELARRDSREALVPIDRDPVPGRYSDLVRKYYEQLGKDPQQQGLGTQGRPSPGDGK